VTWFEREGDQQPAQPGTRHVGEDAVVRANLEWPKHPDLHLSDFAMGDWQASESLSLILVSTTAAGCDLGWRVVIMEPVAV
jgi:hypothetical protein